MNIMKTVTVPETRKEVVDRVVCDRCGVTMPHEGLYERREFELYSESGIVYPEGGILVGWEVQDLCCGCLVVLRTLLEENGFNPKDTRKEV